MMIIKLYIKINITLYLKKNNVFKYVIFLYVKYEQMFKIIVDTNKYS